MVLKISLISHLPALDPHLQDDFQKPAQEFVLASFDILKTFVKLDPTLVKAIYNFTDLLLLMKNGKNNC